MNKKNVHLNGIYIIVGALITVIGSIAVTKYQDRKDNNSYNFKIEKVITTNAEISSDKNGSNSEDKNNALQSDNVTRESMKTQKVKQGGIQAERIKIKQKINLVPDNLEFLYELPLGIILGVTKESDLLVKNFKHINQNGSNKLMSLESNLLCILNQNDLTVHKIQIWKMSKLWEENGIVNSIEKASFIKLLNKYSIVFKLTDELWSAYSRYQLITFELANYKYSFIFPNSLGLATENGLSREKEANKLYYVEIENFMKY